MDPDNLHERCAHLDSLARSRPNRNARAEVEAALHSKWEGLQVHAGRALAAWGDRESVDALRDWLRTSLGKPSGWSVTGEAVACLQRCCTADDANWILDAYFQTSDRLARNSLLALLDVVPVPLLEARIRTESEAGHAAHSEAASIAARRLSHRLKVP